MGRMAIVGRLAARDLRRRPVEAVLLLLAILAATTTLTLGLALHGALARPYERTREATRGPDVIAGVGSTPGPDGEQPADVASLEALARDPDVVASSGPYPVIEAGLEARGAGVVVLVQGRDTEPAAVDQPEVIRGRWVGDGGAVLEASFAAEFALDVGDPIAIDGTTFRVAGVAATAAVPPFPEVACLAGHCREAGLVWLDTTDVGGLVEADEQVSYAMNLQLADPDAAPAFVAERTNRVGAPVGTAWQDILAEHANVLGDQRRALLTGSWLLGLLAVASVAVLVGGRMADQTRRLGLLKAVGGTPGLAAAVLLAEYAVVALVAAAGGLVVGRLTAPLLTDPSAGLLGSAGPPPLDAGTVGLVVAAALGVVAVATLVPAVRAARTSTVLALADVARAPRRTPWLIAASGRLPSPLLVGLRVAARRPRRLVLAVASVTVAVSGIVAALTAHAGSQTGSTSPLAGGGGRDDAFDQVIVAVTITLIALAALNAVIIAWATALDARHTSALTRALGATRGQVAAGLSAAQVLPGLVGATLGVPAGLALVAAVDPGDTTTLPPWQLAAVVAGSVVAITALTAVPARLGARRPVADTLQSELV